MNAELERLNSVLLTTLSQATGNILDNRELLSTLDATKAAAVDISGALAESVRLQVCLGSIQYIFKQICFHVLHSVHRTCHTSCAISFLWGTCLSEQIREGATLLFLSECSLASHRCVITAGRLGARAQSVSASSTSGCCIVLCAAGAASAEPHVQDVSGHFPGVVQKSAVCSGTQRRCGIACGGNQRGVQSSSSCHL